MRRQYTTPILTGSKTNIHAIICFRINGDLRCLTVNSITITVLADLYFLFGRFIEDRRFLRFYGDQYREYMKTVPRMIPRWRSGA